ncbi:MAG: hypothetical protein ACLUB5_05045 [Bifidobacterium dentium]
MLSNKDSQKYDAIRQFGMGGARRRRLRRGRIRRGILRHFGSMFGGGWRWSVWHGRQWLAHPLPDRWRQSDINDIFSMFGGGAGGPPGRPYGGS